MFRRIMYLLAETRKQLEITSQTLLDVLHITDLQKETGLARKLIVSYKILLVQ